MKDIQYIGAAHSRTITSTSWTSVGITHDTTTWDKSNNFQVTVSDIAAAFLLANPTQFQEADLDLDFSGILDSMGSGVEIDTLPTTLRNETALFPLVPDTVFFPALVDGVAKKVNLELLETYDSNMVGVQIPNSYTWDPDDSVLAASGASATTISLPGFPAVSFPGYLRPVMVRRMGTGTCTIAAGSGGSISKAASLPLTLRQQHSVAFFQPYFYADNLCIYLVWGDLG